MAISIYRIGDPNEAEEGPINLYVVLDDMTKTVFYAGITSDMMRRARQHWYDPDSKAKQRLRSVLAAGGTCSMIVVASFETREEARDVERALHEAHPSLLGSGQPQVAGSAQSAEKTGHNTNRELK